MESVYYQVNGIRLHALQDGKSGGEIILFLHGFPEFSYAWHKQLPFFASKGFQAVAPDLRGYNLSSKPKGIKAYVVDKLVADVAALINKLSPNKVTLVGHDWGGGVAWKIAMQHPHLLNKLVILNMPHWSAVSSTIRKNPRQMLKSWYTLFFQLPCLPEWLTKLKNASFLKKTMAGTSNPDTFQKRDLAKYEMAWKRPYAMTAMINWYRALRYNVSETYTDITVPTLLIWGKKDAFLVPELAQSSIEHCAQGRLVMLDDATHWLHHEKPNEINHLIWDFVEE